MNSFLHLSVAIATFVCPDLFPASAHSNVVRLNHKGVRISVGFSPDSKTLAVGGSESFIRLWDVATAKQIKAIGTPNVKAGFTRLSFFPDGTLVSAGWISDDVGKTIGWGGEGIVRTWDVKSGKEKQRVGRGDGIWILATSPNGETIAFNHSNKIYIFNVKKNQIVHTVSAGGAVDSAAISGDNKLLATAHGGGKVRLWDVATGVLVREIHARQVVVTGSQAVAFSPDGKILATTGAKVRLWNAASGEEIATLGTADVTYWCVTISANGRYLAAGASVGVLHLWDFKTHKLVGSWKEGAVSVAISPDGRWLAFGRNIDGAGLIEIGKQK